MTFRIYVYSLCKTIINQVYNLNSTVDAVADYTKLSLDAEFGFRWYGDSPITILAQRIIELQENCISWHPENKELADDFTAYVERNSDELFDYAGLPYNHCSPMQVMFEKWVEDKVREFKRYAHALEDASELISDSYEISRAQDKVISRVSALNEFIINVFYVIF